MQCYRLYVCSSNQQNQANKADDDERIAAATSAAFESFTIVPGTGWFRGRRESVRVLMVATDDEDQVVALARTLRQLLEQDGVGIESGGVYRRVTADG